MTLPMHFARFSWGRLVSPRFRHTGFRCLVDYRVCKRLALVGVGEVAGKDAGWQQHHKKHQE